MTSVIRSKIGMIQFVGIRSINVGGKELLLIGILSPTIIGDEIVSNDEGICNQLLR